MNSKAVIVLVALLAAFLGAHFAVVLLTVTLTAVLIALGILTERIAVTVCRDGWRMVRVHREAYG